MKTFPIFPSVLAAALVFGATALQSFAQNNSPSFNCKKASGPVPKLICKDAKLSALDRKMSDVYTKSLEQPAEQVAEQKKLQRTWLKQRDDCSKSTDMRSCLRSSYERRIAEIQIQSGQLQAPKVVTWNCEHAEAGKIFKTAYYNQTDPPSAFVTYGDEQVIALLEPSGSGSRYRGHSFEFWEHQGEATVTWSGRKLLCKPQ